MYSKLEGGLTVGSISNLPPCTCMHACTHTQTNKQTHTHTHTHTNPPAAKFWWSRENRCPYYVPVLSLDYCCYIPYMFSIFIKIIFECYNLLIDLVPEIIKHTERKQIWSKYYLTISNFLKKLVWLLSFWIEYGKNY